MKIHFTIGMTEHIKHLNTVTYETTWHDASSTNLPVLTRHHCKCSLQKRWIANQWWGVSQSTYIVSRQTEASPDSLILMTLTLTHFVTSQLNQCINSILPLLVKAWTAASHEAELLTAGSSVYDESWLRSREMTHLGARHRTRVESITMASGLRAFAEGYFPQTSANAAHFHRSHLNPPSALFNVSFFISPCRPHTAELPSSSVCSRWNLLFLVTNAQSVMLMCFWKHLLYGKSLQSTLNGSFVSKFGFCAIRCYSHLD